eukprot:Hpha_TRINITY_DN8145_c0_g1::TRINITY_DN8145_c0_g1_i1::g.172069::m.172069
MSKWNPSAGSRRGPVGGAAATQKQKLDALRKQRQARETERRRISAAELVQRIFRGYKARHTARQRAEEELDWCLKNRGESGALVLLCSSYALLPPSRRRAHAQSLVDAVAESDLEPLRAQGAARVPQMRCVPTSPALAVLRCAALVEAACGATGASRVAVLRAATEP